MRRVILATICAFFSSWMMTLAQEVMVVKYNNGNTRIEEVDQVSEISFTSVGEVEDNTPNDVSGGLVSYYTFDSKSVYDNQGANDGFQNGGSYILDTPNETGYALNLKSNDYISIGAAPLDGKTNYSVSMWIKDFGAGAILRTVKGSDVTAPSLYVTEDVSLKLYTGLSYYGGTSNIYSADMSYYQSGQWVMVAIVCEQSGNSIKSTLYINGRKVDSGTSNLTNANGGTSMIIGGSYPLKIDNIRFYGVTLRDEDIADIYNREKEPARLVVTPQELFIDEETDEVTITAENQTFNLMPFTVSDNLGILRITPSKGYIPARGEQAIKITIDDRDHIEKFQKGAVNVHAEGGANAVSIQITKGKEVTKSDVEMKRGLLAYYPFDDEQSRDVMPYEYDGTLNGGQFKNDTPNGKGKSLLLKKGESMLIGYAPLDGKNNYSVSMWVKDFGAGAILKAIKGSDVTAPSLYVTEDVSLKFYTGLSYYGGTSKIYSADMSNYQSGQWVMVTIVCEPSGNSIKSTLYINGKRVDSGTSNLTNAKGGTSMTIGGGEPLMIDNIRLYSVTLTDDEVAEIYASERR